MTTPGPAERAAFARRAQRLMRWYPAGWRARYGEEFAELLIADLHERPRSPRRTADVVRNGLVARLASAGLAGHPLDPPAATSASLATAACSLAAFLVLAAAMWAQLAVGWRWARPASPATMLAMQVMSAAMLALALLMLAATIPVIWSCVRAARAGASRRLRGPALLLAGGAIVLLIGGRHFQNAWPGTGAHWWAHQALAPGGVAAFAWACTLSVTSYWAHPAALASFPAAELAWMGVSPAAGLSLVAGAAMLVRRTTLPPPVLRWQTRVGAAAELAMAAFLAAATCWVAQGTPAPYGLFHAGAIDVASLAVMALALVTGWQALRRAHAGAPSAR